VFGWQLIVFNLENDFWEFLSFMMKIYSSGKFSVYCAWSLGALLAWVYFKFIHDRILLYYCGDMHWGL
jgi:hypothetical protein